MRLRRFGSVVGVLYALGWAPNAGAQIITSIAGNTSVSDGLKARGTPLVISRAVAADQDGFIYIADDGSHVVRRIDPGTGIATIIAGGGTVVDDLIPVPARSAFFNNPVALAVGAGRNLYIADDANNRIRLVTPNGFVTTVAGNGSSGFSGDGGPATRAQLSLPTWVALDSEGNLYITDRGNRAIRKVEASTGVITTIAGGPNATGTGDGIPAKDAKLSNPQSIAVDAAGNVFFVDEGDQVVRKVETATGLISTVAGTAGSPGTTGDGGPATSARLRFPRGVAVAPNGDLYVGHAERVRKVSAETGIIATVLGGGSNILAEGRPGAEVRIPDGVEQLFLTSANVLLVALAGDSLIATLDLNTGIFGVLAGDPLRVGDGGPAATAAVSQPQKLALDATGNLYIADKFHHRVRRVSPGAGGVGTGTITTVAGTGVPAFAETSGPAANAGITFPTGIFVDSSNRLYFTDNFRRVRQVSADGTLRTVAGSPTQSFAGDGGPATSAQLDDPQGLVADSAGNLYIADSGNHRVRKVDTSGIISTIAGTGEAAYSGDGGPATSARLNFPTDLLLDGRGGLLIADRRNHRVRRLDLSTGIITTFAFDGRDRYGGDGGPATAASAGQLRGLAMDAQGNVYVSGQNSVRRIDAATGVVTTVAGGASAGFTGDGGLATLARLSGLQGVLLDSAGNIIFADSVNNRVRRVSVTAVVPVLAVSPLALTFSALQGGASPASQSVQISTSNLVSASWTASLRLNTGSGWLSVRPVTGVTPGVLQVSVNSSALATGTYTGSITILAPGATNSPQTVAVTLAVTPGGNPQLALDPIFLTFRATQGGNSPAPQTVALTNPGGGALQWSSTVETSNGGNWLSVSPSSGAGAATLTVSATLGSLPSGVYQGLVRLRNRTTGQSEVISVSFIVSQPVSSLGLSQTGALFTVNEGGSFVAPETLLVVNAGQREMAWQAQAISLSGGDWLKVSPPSGTSSGGGAGTALTLTPSPVGLRPGVYDALVTVTARGAANSPQILLARLNVQPSSTAPVATIRPGGIALVGVAGGGTQQGSLTVSTSGGPVLSFVVSASTSDGAAWLSVSPPGSSLQGSADRASISVQANPARLAAGAYRGKVTIAFSTGVTQEAGVLLVVVPPGTVAAAAREASLQGEPLQASAACDEKLHPLHTALVNNFRLPNGWATPVLVQVLDNCGNPVTDSQVVGAFTNGDPALPLERHIGNGVYSGMWNPGKSGDTAITVLVIRDGRERGRTPPEGGDPFRGSVAAAGAADFRGPLVPRNGVVHGASFNVIGGVKREIPLAPGQIFSVFGSNLADRQSSAGVIPLPRTLAGVTAKLGDKDLPLYYSDKGQLNAQIPFELPPGGTFGLSVIVGGIASPPQLVTLTSAQPGIFTVNSSGSGAGVVTNAAGALIDSSNPARRGEVVIVWATGLGATNANPPVATGEASPSPPNPPARVVEAVTAFAGGVPATVEFAGLTPGLVGLYQVNVRVPDNAPVGEAVELYLRQNQISSNRVTLAVR